MTTEAHTSAFNRENVKFVSNNDLIAAWVYRPTNAPLKGLNSTKSQQYPAMILGHGVGAVKEMGLDRYASRFTELGIICVAFDYRHFGESSGEPRQLLNIDLQLQDWDAALNYTSKLDDVDPDRIGIFGSSFGGGHVISVAAKDKRVKAVISQCPFTSGLYSSQTIGLVPLIKLGVLGLRDFLFSRGNNIIPIKLAGEPGETALMNAPDVYQYKQLIPPTMTLSNYVAARFALYLGFYNPGWKTSSIHCPILFAVCGKDTVAPPEPTLRYAKQAPKSTIKLYEHMGHFEIYTGQNFDIATKDYLEFLSKHL
ncbi:related to hydrolases of the alpha/beta superfamily [Melanopsichium pennsylvanicum]|uniref:Related to hydrolases of the alpha/beta superfamily n=1 Tax=Melanopsichium pennsylvanicum TaxID=63383 RepID=A0AAJ4XP12_9BASI|nr:related to hydrolases of the alpha/beta superfamily [Melanopsichium pennsylvanicum]